MDFTTHVTQDGCIVRDEKGNFVIELPTEEEALEWIRDNENSYIREEKITISPYEQFVYYCKNLPGKCFLDRKLATTNEKVLKKFIDSFEKSRSVRVITTIESRGGEYFYIVEDVVED